MNKTKIIIAGSILSILLLAFIFIGKKMYLYKVNIKKAGGLTSQTNTNVNRIVKKLVPLKKEKGTYFECFEAVDIAPFYEKKGGKVYFENFILEGVDYNSFEAIGDGNIFAKDKNFVYAFGNPLENMDPNTFEDLGKDLIKDKNGVYYAGNELSDRLTNGLPSGKEPEIDENDVMNCAELLQMNSYEFLDNEKDKKLIRKMDNNEFVIRKIDSLDPKTFQIVNYKGDEILIIGTYIKDKRAVYLFKHDTYSDKDKLYALIKIESADPESFEIINRFYVKDKDAIFAAFYKPGDGDPEFKKIAGSDLSSFRIVDDNNPLSNQFHVYYFGITAEDNSNYYARELLIPKNKKINEWIGNLNDAPMSCEAVCKEINLDISIDGCYDSNFNLCTVSSMGVCSAGNDKTFINKDYKTNCCCSGSSFKWEDKNNKQLTFCISTDGLNPFVKGTTRSTNIVGNSIDPFGTTMEDSCNGNEIIDYYCGLGGGVNNQMGMICPNGCQDGVCLPFDKNKINNSTERTTKWEDERLSFEYDPIFFLINVTQDKTIHLKEKRTGMEYGSIGIWEINNGLTFEMLYSSTKLDTADYRDVKTVQIGNYNYIKSTGVWVKTGKLVGINYQTVINNKYQLGVENNLAYHSLTNESIKKIEKIINSIVVKN